AIPVGAINKYFCDVIKVPAKLVKKKYRCPFLSIWTHAEVNKLNAAYWSVGISNIEYQVIKYVVNSSYSVAIVNQHIE
ncbi:9268_t:CDS:2, partial [Gigaspora margarita]